MGAFCAQFPDSFLFSKPQFSHLWNGINICRGSSKYCEGPMQEFCDSSGRKGIILIALLSFKCSAVNWICCSRSNLIRAKYSRAICFCNWDIASITAPFTASISFFAITAYFRVWQFSIGIGIIKTALICTKLYLKSSFISHLKWLSCQDCPSAPTLPKRFNL